MAVLEDPVTSWIATGCTFSATIICIYLCCQHLRNYTQPAFQRYILRIVFLVPFYSIASWLALLYRKNALYFETPRDCYEAWVIYNFMALCMAYVGGPGAVVVKAEGKVIKPSWVLCTCCLSPMPVNGFFLRRCKQGTLQFVIAKPFLAAFTLLLNVGELYTVGDWSLSNGYAYIAFIYNLCYSLALFWMLLFYVGTEELLAPYKPLLKFVTFKTVIFLTFWQGLAVTFLASRLHFEPEDSEAIQNWLICVEMFIAAVGMLFAFPYAEYQLGGHATPGWKLDAVLHSLSIADVVEDVIHVWNPDYKSYILYSDGGPTAAGRKKKFRGRAQKRIPFNIQNIPGILGSGVLSGVNMAVSGVNFVTHGKLKLKKAKGPVPVTEGDPEAGEWYSAAQKENLMIQLMKKPQMLVSWIPKITELERKQAELVDSDSDADYDEDNQQDNQLDDDVLTSDASDVERSHTIRRNYQGRQALATSDTDDEWQGEARESKMLLDRASDSEVDITWARFPSLRYSPAVISAFDSDWAQFPSGAARTSLERRSRSSAGSKSGHQHMPLPVSELETQISLKHLPETLYSEDESVKSVVQQNGSGPASMARASSAAAASQQQHYNYVDQVVPAPNAAGSQRASLNGEQTSGEDQDAGLRPDASQQQQDSTEASVAASGSAGSKVAASLESQGSGATHPQAEASNDAASSTSKPQSASPEGYAAVATAAGGEDIDTGDVWWIAVTELQAQLLVDAVCKVLPEDQHKSMLSHLHATLWDANDPVLGLQDGLRERLLPTVGTEVTMEVDAMLQSTAVTAARVKFLSAPSEVSAIPFPHIKLLVAANCPPGAAHELPAMAEQGQAEVIVLPEPVQLKGVIRCFTE